MACEVEAREGRRRCSPPPPRRRTRRCLESDAAISMSVPESREGQGFGVEESEQFDVYWTRRLIGAHGNFAFFLILKHYYDLFSFHKSLTVGIHTIYRVCLFGFNFLS